MQTPPQRRCIEITLLFWWLTMSHATKNFDACKETAQITIKSSLPTALSSSLFPRTAVFKDIQLRIRHILKDGVQWWFLFSSRNKVWRIKRWTYDAYILHPLITNSHHKNHVFSYKMQQLWRKILRWEVGRSDVRTPNIIYKIIHLLKSQLAESANDGPQEVRHSRQNSIWTFTIQLNREGNIFVMFDHPSFLKALKWGKLIVFAKCLPNAPHHYATI